MNWRVAKSLEVLREQLNKAFPMRNKVSDGGIGDAEHASRNSDHNPYIKVGTMGIVRARDFTHDPQTGIDCQWLADCLVRHKDPRIRYIIWNSQKCSATVQPWTWRPYSGPNAHKHHLHISVVEDAAGFDDAHPWALDFPQTEADDIARIA